MTTEQVQAAQVASPEPRIGSVSYLNALPLTCGLEDRVVFTTPSRLAGLLRRGEIDVALVSITEAISNADYAVVDGVAIASAGPVRSVFLAHRVPLDDVRKVHCDPASLSSVGLLRVLLGERGQQPPFKTLARYEDARTHDAVLLIGDRALDFALNPGEYRIWDLGAAWFELTSLPFVHAAWTVRPGVTAPGLGAALREARDRGLERLEELIRARTDYTLEFRREYLTENVRFELGAPARQGLRVFTQLLRRHGRRDVVEPRFID